MGPREFWSPKKDSDPKIFGVQKILDQTNFERKIFGVQKDLVINLGPKSFELQKLIIGLRPNRFWVQKLNLWLQKMLSPKIVRSKMLGKKKRVKKCGL